MVFEYRTLRPRLQCCYRRRAAPAAVRLAMNQRGCDDCPVHIRQNPPFAASQGLRPRVWPPVQRRGRQLDRLRRRQRAGHLADRARRQPPRGQLSGATQGQAAHPRGLQVVPARSTGGAGHRLPAATRVQTVVGWVSGVSFAVGNVGRSQIETPRLASLRDTAFVGPHVDNVAADILRDTRIDRG